MILLLLLASPILGLILWSINANIRAQLSARAPALNRLYPVVKRAQLVKRPSATTPKLSSTPFGHSAARGKMVVEGPGGLRLCQAHRGAIQLTGERIWENPSLSSNFLSANRATQILRNLLEDNSRYRQLVNTFHGLAGLENDLTDLQKLKADPGQELAAGLREAQQIFNAFATVWRFSPRGFEPLNFDRRWLFLTDC